MPLDAPDWQAATDVAPNTQGTQSAGAGVRVSQKTYTLPATCTGVLILTNNTTGQTMTVSAIGGVSRYSYLNAATVTPGARAPFWVDVQGQAEQNVEVDLSVPVNMAGADTISATIIALGASGFQVITAPPLQPLQVDLGGRAVSITPNPLPVAINGLTTPNPLPVAIDGLTTPNPLPTTTAPAVPAAGAIIGGSVATLNGGPSTILTIPAGRTWKGSVFCTATANIVAAVKTAGAGVVPAAGTLLAQTDTGAPVAVSDVYVQAPAGNAVTLTLSTSGANGDGGAVGVLL